jgi:hypothetical protein
MATILDRYGIKEVADVVFYEIDNNGAAGAPVLYLDTLKVSTIEQTAENTSARGGKGNPELIMWDYGKEITVTLEDALFSAKSMALMYGVDPTTSDFNQTLTKLKKTVALNQVENGKVSTQAGEITIPSTGAKFYDANGKEVTGATLTDPKEAVYCTFDLTIENATEITISSDKFPGTYYITGDTYARSETTGKDELFQFIIPKAKMQSEVTLTMEAEGDPSTFSMNLKVLRPASGDMMKLVKYSLPATETNNVDPTGLG